MIVIKIITVTQQRQYVTSFTHYVTNGVKAYQMRTNLGNV